MKTKNLVEAFATLFSFVIVFVLIGVLTASFSKSSGKDTDNIKSEQDIIQSACTHTFGEWKTTKKPTCSVKGTQSRICSLCEYEETKEIATTIHNLIETMYQAPTCTATGTRQTKCNDCQQYFLEELPPTHKYSALTCTENSVCSVCGDVGQLATGHTEVTLEAVAPTCTTTGLTEGKTCSVCDEILVAQVEISALGHTIETIPAVDVTCTTDGYTEASYCSECDEVFVKREVIKATGHTNDGIWHKKADGTFYQDCSSCGIYMKTADVVTFNISYNIGDITYTDRQGNIVTAPCVDIKEEKASIDSDKTVFIEASTYSASGGTYTEFSIQVTNCTYEIRQVNNNTYEIYLSNAVGDVAITFTGK